jgi:diguanylate cyclase (GGDEF)-like protein
MRFFTNPRYGQVLTLRCGELVLSKASEENTFEFGPGTQAQPTMIIETAPTPAKTLENPLRALKAANEAAYHWSVDSDELIWSANVSDILGCPPEAVSTAKRFASLLDPDNLSTRYDMVMNTQALDKGDGIGFQLEYMFRPNGRGNDASFWIEEHGRWFGEGDGRPKHVHGVIRRVDERHDRDQHLTFMGNHDPLTGLMNRGRLGEALEETVIAAQRDGSKCSLAVVSINNLEIVNDSYGFDVADEVIVAVGRRLKQVMRTGDGLARYSGSKFGIIFNNCTEEELPVAIERLMSVIRDSVVETSHGPVWVMLSVGAVTIPTHADSANSAMTRAEVALTEASHMPSDNYVIFKPSKSKANEQLLNSRCATEIVRCLKTDGFRLAFQPIVNAKTGVIEHHEALLRMIDEAGDVVAAGHLVPIAERLGLIRLIDRAVTQMAVATLNTYPEAKLAINISGTTATDKRWHLELIETIKANKQVASRLAIEITETVALSDFEATRSLVEQLLALGCKVAIDDFGAGYTSFKNLRDLPVQVIKIDGTFCRNLAVSQENLYFVKSLVDLVHNFGRKVVAEWVATEEDAELLRHIGVDYLQGNLLGAATLTAPWNSEHSNNFSIGTAHSEPVTFNTLSIDQIEMPEIETMATAAPSTIVTETSLREEPVIAAIETVEVPAVTSDDDDVARLRETLDLLNAVFRRNPEPAPESELAEAV